MAIFTTGFAACAMNPAFVNVALRFAAPDAKPLSFADVQDAAAGDDPVVLGVLLAHAAATNASTPITATNFVDFRMFPPLVSRLTDSNPTRKNGKVLGVSP